MNPKIIVLIVAAIIVAGGTAFLVRQFLLDSGPSQETEAEQETSEILVASKNLPMGHLVEAGDLVWTEWPNEGLHTNYLDQENTAIDDLNGFVVRYGITGGEPVTRGRVVGPGEKGFLAAVLGSGMRAVTVPINRTSGIAGFIFPGDRVDVLLTKTALDNSGTEHLAGETVLKNVRVLAVDLRVNDQDKGSPELGKSVTLEVTPKMAEKVSMLTRLGVISLALRSLKMVDGQGIEIYSPDDDLPVSNAQTHTWDAEVSNLVPPLNPKVETLTISRGGLTEVVQVDKNDDGGR
jgi:pilus assembly protein CpaB